MHKSRREDEKIISRNPKRITSRTVAEHRAILLAVRLITLVVMIILMTLHLRSVRAFRWEQTVSGGVIVTFSIAMLGLAMCAGMDKCCNTGITFQIYLCGVGAALMGLNAIVILIRWRTATNLTRVVAELLETLGVRLKRHIVWKVVLSAIASVGMLVDVILMTVLIT